MFLPSLHPFEDGTFAEIQLGSDCPGYPHRNSLLSRLFPRQTANHIFTSIHKLSAYNAFVGYLCQVIELRVIQHAISIGIKSFENIP